MAPLVDAGPPSSLMFYVLISQSSRAASLKLKSSAVVSSVPTWLTFSARFGPWRVEFYSLIYATILALGMPSSVASLVILTIQIKLCST